jgi:asparagine synthase (glutamine-hydrolysing)
MFHTPSISETKKQAREMQIPIIIQKTKGEKEEELKDLENAIKIAIEKYKIEGIVTGALYSDYQFSRIKKICEKLKIKCVNPLWHKDEIEYLNELIKNNFKIVITGVFAYPLDKNWLGRIIDEKFVKDAVELEEKYKIHAAGEGGEFETFVIDCPLFKNELKIKSFRDFKEGENSWRRELKIQ